MLSTPDLAARAGPDGAAAEFVVDGRALAVQRQDLLGGWTGWHVHDVTEPQTRLDSPLAERARSRFRAEASTRLGLSLHPGRTARTVAELATRCWRARPRTRNRSSRRRGGGLTLVGVGGPVRRMLQLTGVESLFTVRGAEGGAAARHGRSEPA